MPESGKRRIPGNFFRCPGNRLGQDVRGADFDDIRTVFLQIGPNVPLLPQKTVFPVSWKSKRFLVFDNQRFGNLFGESPGIVLDKDQGRVIPFPVEIHALQMVTPDASSRRTPEVVEIDNDETAHFSFSFIR